MRPLEHSRLTAVLRHEMSVMYRNEKCESAKILRGYGTFFSKIFSWKVIKVLDVLDGLGAIVTINRFRASNSK